MTRTVVNLKVRFEAERLRVRDHACLIYDSEPARLRFLVPFIGIGLARNEQCFCIAAADRHEATLRALHENGVDVARARREGRLRMLTTEETYLAGEDFSGEAMLALLRETARASRAAGFPAFRVTGNAGWLAERREARGRFVSYERKVNELIASTSCVALCQYHRLQLDPHLLSGALDTHPLVVVNDEVCINRHCRLAAEAGADRRLPPFEETLWRIRCEESASRCGHDALRSGLHVLESLGAVVSVTDVRSGRRLAWLGPPPEVLTGCGLMSGEPAADGDPHAAALTPVRTLDVPVRKGRPACRVAILAASGRPSPAGDAGLDGNDPPAGTFGSPACWPTGLILLAAAMIARSTGCAEIAASLEEASAQLGT